MRTVAIGELKNQLSAYLKKVRAGQEIIIRDRKVSIAKIVPLDTHDLDLEEQVLVAEGLLIPPKRRFDAERFFAIGKGVRTKPVSEAVLRRVINEVREDIDVSFLGRQRARPRVRPRSKKSSS